MDFKTQDTLTSDLVSSLQAKLNIDLTEGTPERDIFVEAPVTGQLLNIWNALQYLFMLQSPFIYSDQLLIGDLDIFCNNNGVLTIPATYSTGQVLFFTYTEPSKDIVITSSNSCATASGQNYTVTGYYTLSYINRATFYNAINRRWEILVNVTAQTPGTAGTTAALTITTVNGTITGIEGVTNTAAITGGTDVGTIQQRLALVKQNFKGRNLATETGIQLYVNNFTKNATIIGSNDPLMLRTNNLGGGIDIYIRDDIELGAVDTVTITSTGLHTLTNPTYTSTGITFVSQPVHLIATVSKNGTTLSNTYYSLSKDNGLLTNSTRSIDKLILTSTGISNIGKFVSNDVVVINYDYNSLLHTIEDGLNSSINVYDNRDFLLREQSFFTVDVYMQVSLFTGYALANVISSSSTPIANYINGIVSGYIELSSVVSLVKNTAGVNNVNLTTAVLTPSDGRIKTTAGDIIVNSNEYAKSGNINLVVWTA